jgi:hypothetical protein
MSAIVRNVTRMARLQAAKLPIGSAIALGLGLGYVKPGTRAPRYNGAGLSGDRDAIAGDFRAAVRSKMGDAVKRG